MMGKTCTSRRERVSMNLSRMDDEDIGIMIRAWSSVYLPRRRIIYGSSLSDLLSKLEDRMVVFLVWLCSCLPMYPK